MPRRASVWMRFQTLQQRREILLQLGAGLAEGVRPHDDAAAVGELELAGDAAQLGPGLFVLDLPRHAAGVVERREDKVAPGEREVGGDRGALLVLGFAGDLDDDRLALLQDLLDLRAAAVRRLGVARLRHDVLDGEETVLAGSVVDERGVQGGLEIRDHAAIDIAARQTPLSDFDLVVLEPGVGDHGDA